VASEGHLSAAHEATVDAEGSDVQVRAFPPPLRQKLVRVVLCLVHVAEVSVDDEVCVLTLFDRDGVAAEYSAVTAQLLAPKQALIHWCSAEQPCTTNERQRAVRVSQGSSGLTLDGSLAEISDGRKSGADAS
jgi:hypothetical protein